MSENTHLYVWQNQGNFTFKQDYITEEPHSRQANHIHKTKSAAQVTQHWIFPPYNLHTLYILFSLPKWENFSHHPLLQEESREIKQKILQLVLPSTSSVVLRGQKNPNITDESNVLHWDFFMYVQRLGKNYCIREGTYLWFKAWLV